MALRLLKLLAMLESIVLPRDDDDELDADCRESTNNASIIYDQQRKLLLQQISNSQSTKLKDFDNKTKTVALIWTLELLRAVEPLSCSLRTNAGLGDGTNIWSPGKVRFRI